MAHSTVSPVCKAIDPKLITYLDGINANPRLREFFEECAALDSDDEIKILTQVAAYLRGKSHG
jgi:hypothetical protein